VPVVESDNRLAGIIAQGDIAKRGPSEKEVGDVVEKISRPSGKRSVRWQMAPGAATRLRELLVANFTRKITNSPGIWTIAPR
jgi:hypothetical protein